MRVLRHHDRPSQRRQERPVYGVSVIELPIITAILAGLVATVLVIIFNIVTRYAAAAMCLPDIPAIVKIFSVVVWLAWRQLVVCLIAEPLPSWRSPAG
jgi:hypothetical protein